MDRTQRLRPYPMNGASSRHTVPIAITVALSLMVVLDIVLVMRPALVSSLSALLRELLSAQDGHAWLVAGLRLGLAVGGIALGIAMLATFVRGVQAFPYVWLAPVLVGFSSVVMARATIVLPLPLSPLGFAVMSAALLLGGGSLVQLRGLAPKIAGSVVLAVPLLVLVLAYAHASGGLSRLPLRMDDHARLFLFVLTMTSIGVAFVAIASPSALLAHRARRERPAAERDVHLRRAIEHARDSEARAAQAEELAARAEHALRLQGAELEAALATQDELEGFAARTRPSLARLVVPACALAVILAGLATGYYAAYRPLQAQAAASHAALTSARRDHTRALAALRSRAQSERTTSDGALIAARAASDALTASLAQAKASVSACELQLTAASAVAAEPPKSRASIAKTKPKAKVVARAARKPQPQTTAKPRAAKPGVSASDDPLLGL